MLIFGFYHDAKSTQMNLIEEEKNQISIDLHPTTFRRAANLCVPLLLWFDFGNFFFFSSLFYTHMTSSHGIRVLVYFFLLLPCERE
jgi:hypothetical protein